MERNNKQIKELEKRKKSLQNALNTTSPMSFAEVSANIAESQIDSLFGQATGIRHNLDKSPGIYFENAAYGEMSRQQATQAKIDTLGGVDKAVAFDVASASVKAGEDSKTLDGKIAAALASAGLKVDEKNIEMMRQALAEGGDKLVGKLKEAFENMTKPAFTKSVSDTVKGIHQANMDTNADVMREKVNAFIKSHIGNATGEEAERRRTEAIEKLKNAGILDENGNVVTGIDGLIAWSKAKAGAMNSSERVSIDGEGVNFTTSLNKDGSTKATARIDARSSYVGGVSHTRDIVDTTNLKGNEVFQNALNEFRIVHGRDPKDMADKTTD